MSDRIFPCWCVKYVCWCFRWQTDAAFIAQLSSASSSGKTNLKLPSSLWATRATWSVHERSARRVCPLNRTLSLLNLKDKSAKYLAYSMLCMDDDLDILHVYLKKKVFCILPHQETLKKAQKRLNYQLLKTNQNQILVKFKGQTNII